MRLHCDNFVQWDLDKKKEETATITTDCNMYEYHSFHAEL